MSEEASELKGGHPPAVKVGGMRITQHKPVHGKPEAVQEKATEEEEEEVEQVVSYSPPKQPMMISGAVAKGDADFPAVAVQAIHNKPVASHDYRTHSSKPNIIQQPRKQ